MCVEKRVNKCIYCFFSASLNDIGSRSHPFSGDSHSGVGHSVVAQQLNIILGDKRTFATGVEGLILLLLLLFLLLFLVDVVLVNLHLESIPGLERAIRTWKDLLLRFVDAQRLFHHGGKIV